MNRENGISAKPSSQIEIRLSGSGGQGLVLAGVILAEAAVLFDNKNAVQSQSYGPEARGGASKSEVIISEEDIVYPKARKVSILLALTQEAADKYSYDVIPGAVVILDQDLVEQPPAGEFKLYRLPLVGIARDKVGKAFVANIVALGAIVGLTKIVSREAITEAVLRRVPKGTEELNKKALAMGFEAAEKAI